MSFTLGRAANAWNEIARADKNMVAKVRTAHTNRLLCCLMAELDASELRVLGAIQARTIRFHKFAEAIPLEQFCTGFRDEDGELLLDYDDAPYFAGCNIAKTETVSRALSRLEQRRLITRWRLRTRWHSVYMPFSERWLAGQIAYHGGAIAAHYPLVVVGEHFRGPDGGVVRVDAIEDGTVHLHPVNARLTNNGSSFALSEESWEDGGYERLTIEEILEARRHRPTWDLR